MKNRLFIFIGSLLLASCETRIDFPLKEKEQVLVVDANIENGVPPTVVLTKSLDFYSAINPTALLASFIHDANVTMSNGSKTQILKEKVGAIINGNLIYVYTIDSANLADAFIGEANKAYSLSITTADGKNYTATTTIPAIAKRPDSLWWKPAPFASNPLDVVVYVQTTDPPGLGNYVRYFTKKNSDIFLPGRNSVFDDQVIDNSTYQLQVEPGINRNFPMPMDSNYFRYGDTVTLKICNIDKATYNFWSTWEFAYQSIGNPFAQPNKVLGNISNGALGAFYGYGAAFRTIIIPQ